ncbi:hypothetical protein PHJA_002052100 [Phtheirospermum japonicum]|uniref:NAB domain-containing protein n=1 Tax=Phtheirospermum japonicum TaxID=374723 RepID=A0A830CLE1_9LAMI|nr:hypothetical protein PHJA_002052100 [Phtheirospermum japonicum]
MVAKSEKTGGGCGDAAAAVVVVGASNQPSRRRRSFNKPSWLLCNIADLDERIKMLTRKKNPKENSPDTFAMRANSYYHERPQLLELLHDLYNGYLSLADRYCQALAKNQTPNNRPSRCSSPIPISKSDDESEVVDSDAESSLSFQPPPMIVKTKEMDFDMVIADLVMKAVECDIILNEVNVVEKRWGESSRKIELQKNLLDVLESERLILLNDNATLGYRVTALAEENKGLASESLFLKRKAAELARCVLKTREDHRVCMLSRKIEDLQGQIYGLEKRNKEYYEQLVKCEEKKRVDLEDCYRAGRGGGPRPGGFGKCFSFKVKKVEKSEKSGGVEGRKVSKMWDKVKKFDLLLCGPHVDCATT